MVTEKFERYATPRLRSISEELNAIDSVIIANLETLPGQPALIKRLVRRCDDISLELDALRMEIPEDGSSADEKKNPEQSADGSGLNP